MKGLESRVTSLNNFLVLIFASHNGMGTSVPHGGMWHCSNYQYTCERIFFPLPPTPTCTEPHQQLYVRLFLRKRQWLRVANIRYPDICPNMDTLARTLVEEGFLDGGEFCSVKGEVGRLLG